MLSKCANPASTTVFRYLHQGRLFCLDIPTDLRLTDPANAAPGRKKAPHRTEFFWLCGECSTRLTVVYRKEGGVTTRSLTAARTSG